MSEIVKKNGNQPALWDPFAAMREMMRWDPFREMTPQFAAYEPTFNPTFEVRENKDGYVFKADLPGIKKEDVEISLTGNRLQITGKREEEKEAKTDTIYTYERSYGTFARAFTLPDGADLEHVHTDLKDGVLSVMIPKKAIAQPRRIAISSGPKT